MRMSREDEIIDHLTNELCYEDYKVFVEFQVLKHGEIKKLKQENEKIKEKYHQGIMWMYAEACLSLDRGEDIRKQIVPELLDRLEKDLEE